MTQSKASDDSPTTAASMPAADWPTVPGYELLGELGRGGMGVVFRARQMSTKRLVALKLIRDSALASEQDRARFWIEAEAASRVQHPGAVQVYEVGEHAGRPYFVMELVAGGSLDQRLDGRPQPPTQAAKLVSGLALAVQHAHEQNVVHRDLKPANILLAGLAADHQKSTIHSPPAPAEDARLSSVTPKIADFGLAKRLDSQSTAWTQAGAVLGTASYMAPEQAAGRVLEIGPAVDIYALGAILYELLTGRPPFQGDTWQQTVQQVLHDEPLPPARLAPDVPRALETICLKCLEKKPAQRYATAGELADDLGRFLAGVQVAAVPLDDRERLVRLAERDGYRIVGEIGRSPRSTVYHAQFGPLQQHVALKVFQPGICTRDEWEARLRRSAVEWSAVTHPHVIPIHRAGWWDGWPFLAEEYVPSGSLAARLTGKPFPVPQALRLVEQVGEIICYIHRQGVIHGNLKPSNVLLAVDGIPRLVDFSASGGLFFGRLPSGEEEPSGVNHLAPELACDGGAEPRPYTDIYGLGLILYALLTGRSPFDAATAAEALEKVLTREPLPPAHYNSEITPDLEAFCLRCLRKNPWQRYARAYDWLTHLRYIKNRWDV